MRDSTPLSAYDTATRELSGAGLIALSQSGGTPDVSEYGSRARARGAFTVAITNGPESELGQAADATLSLAAGPERAVAASKTFLNQLAALALLSGGTAGRGHEVAEGVRAVSDQLADRLAPLERAVRNVATAFAYGGR